MKKKIYVVVFMLTLFAGVISGIIFTKASTSSVFYSVDYWRMDRISESYTFDSTLGEINTIEFHTTLNKIATENNLIIVKIKYGETEDLRDAVSIYTTDNDSYYKTHVMLADGYVNLSDSKNIYTFNAKDKKQRIAGILGFHVRLTSTINDPQNEGFYNFISLKGDIQDNLHSFEQAMIQAYPNFKMNHQYKTEMTGEKFSFITLEELIFYKKMKAAIPFLLMILLCSILFSESKKISLLKIEGYTSIQIFWKLFFKPYLYISFSFMCLFLLGSAIYYSGNLITVKYFTFISFAQFMQIHGITLIYSTLLLGIIKAIPMKTHLKGKNNLQEVFYGSLLLKGAIVFISLPLLLSGLTNLYKTVQMVSRYHHVNEKIKNWYMMDTQLPTEYHRDIGTERYISIQTRLKKDNELTSYGSGYYWGENGIDPSKKIYFFDDVQVKKQNLVEGEFKEEEIYIFYRKGYQYERDFYQKKVQDYLTTPRAVNIVEYDKKIYNNSVWDLLFTDEIDYKAPILYIPVEDEYKGQIARASFKYNGNVLEAQNYLTQVFKDAGYGRTYSIRSYKSTYDYFYYDNLKYYLHSIVLITIIIVSGYLIASLMIDIDIANNYKKYYISMVEGLSPMPIVLYMMKMSLVTVLAIAMYSILRLKHIDMQQLMIWIGFYFLFEAMLYIKFHFKFKKVRSTHGHRD